MPFYNFGLEGYLKYAIYAAAVVAILLSMFRRPLIGIYVLVPLIPLQTIRYRLNDLPFGESFVYIMLFAVAVGLVRQGKWIIPKTPWSGLLCSYLVFTLGSLWVGASYLNFPLPLPGEQRFSNWLAYMAMPLIFFMVAASVNDMKEIKILVALMCFATLLLDRSFWNSVSGRDFSTYSEDLRQTLSDGGSMGYAGVNGLAAFEAQATVFLLAMASFEKRLWIRLGYLILAVYSALCLMYSLSRGGYVALLAGWIFLGLVRERKLLVFLVSFALIWTTVVPQAVVQRVEMTKGEDGRLDHSSELRLELWEDAMQLIRSNPLFGTGFNTYAYMGRVRQYADTHNYYLKVLIETGVIGMLLFLWLLAKSFGRGWQSFRRGNDPVLRGLGLGLAGWVICAAVSIAFGDRWTYLQIQGFFWVLAALVARGWILQQDAAAKECEEEHALPAGLKLGDQATSTVPV